METKKLQFGCFIGLPIGLLVAVLTTWFLTPVFWWIGIVAGLCAGYLCYDLKEVRAKAPLAWYLAKKRGACFLDWLKEPHPFFWPCLIVWGVIIYFLLQSIWWGSFLGVTEASVGSKVFMSIFMPFVISPTLVVYLLFLPVFGLAIIGAKKKKTFWQPSRFFSREKVEEKMGKNYQEILPTYRNIYGLVLVGLTCLIPIASKAIKKKATIGLKIALTVLWVLFYKMWVLLPRFIWLLIKLIHSHERVICGMDCAVGVFTTYKLLGAKTETMPQLIGLLVFGALIGFTIGTIHAKIIKNTRLAVVFNNY